MIQAELSTLLELFIFILNDKYGVTNLFISGNTCTFNLISDIDLHIMRLNDSLYVTINGKDYSIKNFTINYNNLDVVEKLIDYVDSII